MVLLQYLVPLLAALLIGSLGLSKLHAGHEYIHYSWLTIFSVFILIIGFDRSRGRWISFALFTLLTVFTCGLYLENSGNFLPWLSAVFIAVSLVILLSQLSLHTIFRLALVLCAVMVSVLPAVFEAHITDDEGAAYILPGVAIVLSLLPFLLQYLKTFRAEILWPMISLQQLVLRLTFVTWVYSAADKLGASSFEGYRYILVGLLAAILVIVNIKPFKLSWAHVSQTTYSLMILFVSLFKSVEVLPLIYVIIGATAFGTVFPMQSCVGGAREQDLSALEIGSFGSASFFASLWILYKMKPNMEPYEFIVWSAFLIVVSSKIWSQSEREQTFGKHANETSKKYYYGRIAVQVLVSLYLLGLLLNQKLSLGIA